jgi:hypothetical protein
LYPAGHFGLTLLTFLIFLPLIHVIVFFAGAGAAKIEKLAVVETGAMVELPGCEAVIEQFPLFISFSVVPRTVQFSGVAVV